MTLNQTWTRIGTLLIILVWPCAAFGLSVVVDGSGAEWPLVAPLSQNTGHISRNAAQNGLYVWSDALGDERTDLTTSNPDPPADIETVAITGDATNLYVLVHFNKDTAVTDLPIQVQVGIDLDRIPGSGNTYFMGFADTLVAPSAAWEFMIMTRFGSGGTAPAVFDVGDVDVASAGALNARGADRTVEIAVPWADLGLTSGPDAPLALTFAVFHTEANDNTTDIAGPTVANVIDTVTNYGDPSATLNTWDEVNGDLSIDYHVELWFHLHPDREPTSPLVISEVAYDTDIADEEFIEIFNRASVDIALSGFRLGDEETTGGAEGMMEFPAGGPPVLAGQKVVVARQWAAYHALYGRYPHYELEDTDPIVADMSRDVTWASGQLSLANDGDELLLLDPFATIIDAVAFETASYPGVIAHPGAPKGSSLERSPDRRDTDSCIVDFVVRTTPSPGQGAETCVDPVPPFDPVAVGTPCDDNDPCTAGETCDALGACLGGVSVTCAPDGNTCTSDTCDPAFLGCGAPLTDQPCTDDDACTGPDVCSASGTCENAVPVVCPAASDCVRASCDAALGCFFAAGTTCDDASACTSDTTCDDAGGCIAATTVDCSSLDEGCTVGVCDPASGTCAPGSAPDGTGCDDADLCTEADQCSSGICGGSAVDCSGLDESCRVGVCDGGSGSCETRPALAGTACDDGDACTEGEVCQGGECYGGRDICTADASEPLDTSTQDTASLDTTPEDTGSPDTGVGEDVGLDTLPPADTSAGTDTLMVESDQGGDDGCGCRVTVDSRRAGSARPTAAMLCLIGLLLAGTRRRRR